MKNSPTFILIVVVGLVHGWPPIGRNPSGRATDPRTTIAPPVPPRPSLTDVAVEATSCEYEGRVYPEGHFFPDPCTKCECRRGLLGCMSSACHASPCVDATVVPGECCPTCPNGPNCMGPRGITIPVGGTFRVPRHDLECKCIQMGYYTGATCKLRDE